MSNRKNSTDRGVAETDDDEVIDDTVGPIDDAERARIEDTLRRHRSWRDR